jgi:hypothetical protein
LVQQRPLASAALGEHDVDFLCFAPAAGCTHHQLCDAALLVLTIHLLAAVLRSGCITGQVAALNSAMFKVFVSMFCDCC